MFWKPIKTRRFSRHYAKSFDNNIMEKNKIIFFFKAQDVNWNTLSDFVRILFVLPKPKECFFRNFLGNVWLKELTLSPIPFLSTWKRLLIRVFAKDSSIMHTAYATDNVILLFLVIGQIRVYIYFLNHKFIYCFIHNFLM